jgi:hypothetical protein
MASAAAAPQAAADNNEIKKIRGDKPRIFFIWMTILRKLPVKAIGLRWFPW